jgi:abortive infection bacteriophage resistance protein
MSKPPKTIQDQIALLQSRGMQFADINKAPHFLATISYYRLKGYWWEMQDDLINHHFAPNSIFEDAIDLYNFDRNFRLRNHIKQELNNFFMQFPKTQLYKMGFPANWQNEPIWK